MLGDIDGNGVRNPKLNRAVDSYQHGAVADACGPADLLDANVMYP
jgi:hypothetical protein